MARRRSIRAGYKRTLAACRAAKCKAQGKRASCKLDEETLEACERAARQSHPVRLRGLAGALGAGAYAGALGKIVHGDILPAKVELGALALDEEGALWTDESRAELWRPNYRANPDDARIEALHRQYKRAAGGGEKSNMRYALSTLERNFGVVVPPSLYPHEPAKPVLKPALFHSAPAFSIAKIKREGLKPRRGEGLFKHGGYDTHSQGKLFLSDNFSAAREWQHKVETQLFDQYDQPSKHEAVMLRVRTRETEVDPVGDRDVRGSRYLTASVPPSDLEFFDKSQERWRPLKEYRRGRAGEPTSVEKAHEGIEGLRGLGRARITKVCPALRFDHVGDREGITITAFVLDGPDRGTWVGSIDSEIRDGDLRVMMSEVEPVFQRCGVGTRLYEHTLRIAQKKKLRLVSDSQRSKSAETFWQKQVKKGRAVCIDEQPGHLYVPGEGVKPNRWPCRRFAIAKKRVRSLRGRRA